MNQYDWNIKYEPEETFGPWTVRVWGPDGQLLDYQGRPQRSYMGCSTHENTLRGAKKYVKQIIRRHRKFARRERNKTHEESGTITK